MGYKISSPNLDSVLGQLKALVTGVPIAAKQSSRIIANQILQDSLTLAPFVPEDTGALRSTGRVEAVQEGYAVVYGGSATDGTFVDYAGYVHDNLPSNVPDKHYTTPGSGPKFVEVHFIKRAEEAPEKISEVMQELANGTLTYDRGGNDLNG